MRISTQHVETTNGWNNFEKQIEIAIGDANASRYDDVTWWKMGLQNQVQMQIHQANEGCDPLGHSISEDVMYVNDATNG